MLPCCQPCMTCTGVETAAEEHAVFKFMYSACALRVWEGMPACASAAALRTQTQRQVAHLLPDP